MPVLDHYERKARLTPGLFAVLPASCAITTLGLDKFPLIAALTGLLTAAGGSWLLATLVGDLGRSAQGPLFESWGGSPTTRALRTREPSENPVQRDNWRTAVASVTGIDLLPANEEAEDPDGADQRITAATAQILHLGHESGQPAVRNENVAFGYQRNLYGFRWIGRAVACAATIAQLAAIAGPGQVSTAACLVGTAVSLGFLALWTFLPSADRTRLAADRYARQLFIAAHNHARTNS